MKINSDTKIGALIKKNPDVIDAIASISKHFEKLRNPFLRKVLASRVSIRDAAKIGGTTEQVFFDKLQPLGFIYEGFSKSTESDLKPIPDFYHTLDHRYVETLDVRDLINNGKDPFNKIMDVLAQLPEKYALKLINGFEPTPLITILSRKGYNSYSITVDETLVYTYFKKAAEKPVVEKQKIEETGPVEMQKVIESYGANILRLNVQNLEMPQPMLNILSALENLNDKSLLYVIHDKVPVHLFEKLIDLNFRYNYRKVNEHEVQLLIYRNMP